MTGALVDHIKSKLRSCSVDCCLSFGGSYCWNLPFVSAGETVFLSLIKRYENVELRSSVLHPQKSPRPPCPQDTWPCVESSLWRFSLAVRGYCSLWQRDNYYTSYTRLLVAQIVTMYRRQVTFHWNCFLWRMWTLPHVAADIFCLLWSFTVVLLVCTIFHSWGK